jgi:signal transduction histidine kinase
MLHNVDALKLEQRLLNEQVGILLRHLPGMVLGTLLLASGAAWLLVLQDQQWGQVAGWWGTMLTFSVGRLSLYVWYRKHPPDADSLRHVAFALSAASAGAGLLWGSIALPFFTPEDPYTLAIVAFVLCGVLASSTQSIGSYWPAHVSFSVPCLLPFSVRCMLEGDATLNILGLLFLMYLLFTATFARSFPRALRESIRLRMDNEALVEHLSLAKQQAESSERRKARFLASASHELRQPMHAMGLFVPALQRLVRAQSPSRRELADIADRMQTVLGSMGQLLQVMLEMSRLDSGAVAVRRTPCAINPILLQVGEVLREQARAKGLQLRVVETPLWAQADPAILHTILLNLVGNAVRYTERGGVLMGARRRGTEVEIQVWDTGIGIPASELPLVFDEFYQASNARRTSAPSRGFGLGLSIVHRSAGLLGARPAVRSQMGRGSVFGVSLPHCESVRDAVALPRAPDAGGQVVLVLDNDEQIVRALTHLLTGWGHTVLGAQTMREALVRAWNNDASISLFVVDYHLSEDFHGLHAITRLREILERGVPALVITGDAGVQLPDGEGSRDITLLHKPVDPRALQRWMAEASHRSRQLIRM